MTPAVGGKLHPDVGVEPVGVVDRVVVDDHQVAGRIVDGKPREELVVQACLIIDFLRRSPSLSAVDERANQIRVLQVDEALLPGASLGGVAASPAREVVPAGEHQVHWTPCGRRRR